VADLAGDHFASRLTALESRFQKLRQSLVESARRIEADARFVRVVIEGAHFALPVGRVREVLRYVLLDKMPEAPACMAGLLRIRGKVMPVIDPRRAWGKGHTAPDLDTAIVLVEDGGRTYGVLVDRVDDVVELDAASLHESDATQTALSPCVVSSHLVAGLLVHALDPSRLLAPAHFAELEAAFERWEAAR
jgi:purine-binding chemotaxis protein CheW